MLTSHSPLHAVGRAEAGWFRGKSIPRSVRIPNPKSRATKSNGSKKSPRADPLGIAGAREGIIAAVQTVIRDRFRHTGLLLRRMLETPRSQGRETSKRGGGAARDVAGRAADGVASCR